MKEGADWENLISVQIQTTQVQINKDMSGELTHNKTRTAWLTSPERYQQRIYLETLISAKGFKTDRPAIKRRDPLGEKKAPKKKKKKKKWKKREREKKKEKKEREKKEKKKKKSR